MSGYPRIELLWWEGCPSTEGALTQLREILVELGLGEAEIRTREIRTEAQAADTRFRGSPTILVDGADVDPGAKPEEPNPLTCRVYHRRDGRISPIPDSDDLRAALQAALARARATPA
jgi:hypothetical protein